MAVRDEAQLFFGRPKRVLRNGRGMVFEVDEGREITVWGFGESGRPELPDDLVRAVEEGHGSRFTVVFTAVPQPGKDYWRVRGIERIAHEEDQSRENQEQEEASVEAFAEGTVGSGPEPTEIRFYIERVREEGFDGFEVRDARGEKSYGRLPLGGSLDLELPFPHQDADTVMVRILVRSADGRTVGLRSFAVEKGDVQDGKLRLRLELSEDGRFSVVSPSTGKKLFEKAFVFRSGEKQSREEFVDKEYETGAGEKSATADVSRQHPAAEDRAGKSRQEHESPSRDERQVDRVRETDFRAPDLSAVKEMLSDLAGSVVEKVFREYQEFENVRLKLQYLDLAFRAATDFTQKQFQVLQLAGVKLADPRLPSSERVKNLMDLHNSVFERNFKAFLSVIQEAVGANRMNLQNIGLGKGQAERRIMEKIARREAEVEGPSRDDAPEV